MTPKVDTFEHDIANEIRRKEATLEEIKEVSKSSAPPEVIIPPQKKLPIFTIVLVILLIVAIVGIGGVAYYYFNDSLLPPSSKQKEIKKNDIPRITAEVTKLSPALGQEISRFVTVVEKKDKGYILHINNYSAVFAYMARRENDYIEDLASLFTAPVTASSTPVVEELKATTTPVIVVSTSTQASTSTKSTSTKITPTKPIIITKTKSTTTLPIQEYVVPPPRIEISDNTVIDTHFSNITIANQNIRLYKNNGRSVAYSFVGDKIILISDTQEGILSLKDAILH